MKITRIIRSIGGMFIVAAILTLVFDPYSNVFVILIMGSTLLMLAGPDLDNDILIIKDCIRNKVKK